MPRKWSRDTTKSLTCRVFGCQRIEWGLKWAAENAPKSTRHTVVHGDFRHGNFIVGEEGIRIVLDWEVAHSGDPMEDLGWVCVKTWRFGGRKPVGGFGTREELFEAYEKASGLQRRSEARTMVGGVGRCEVGHRMSAAGHSRRRGS